ncbi:hypothetical protein Tco_1290692, partial [Tanacetum coccineum]
VVFKLATVGAPPLLSATTITTGPPTKGYKRGVRIEIVIYKMYPFEVPDEEGADFIGEDDVVPHVLEDDDAHDDAVDPPS